MPSSHPTRRYLENTLAGCKWKVNLPKKLRFPYDSGLQIQKWAISWYHERLFQTKTKYVQPEKFPDICQNPKTEIFGLDNITYRATQLWKNVPKEVRFSISLPVLKESIEKIRFIFFWCNSCKINIHHLGHT